MGNYYNASDFQLEVLATIFRVDLNELKQIYLSKKEAEHILNRLKRTQNTNNERIGFMYLLDVKKND